MLQKLNNPVVAILMLFFFTCTLISCGGGGSTSGSPDDETEEADTDSNEDQSGIVLSATQLSPGQFLTIYHPSITKGDEVEITFIGADDYVVNTKSGITVDGSVKVPVPPIIETESFEYSEGEVLVCLEGVNDDQPLYITPMPPVLDAEPGEITRDVIEFVIEDFRSGLQQIETYANTIGADVSDSVLEIEEQLLWLESMHTELLGRQLTVETGEGPVVLAGKDLQMLDQLIAAGIFTAAEELGWTPESASSAKAAYEGQEVFDPIEPLQWIKNKGIPGFQALTSYCTVILGVAALATVVPATPVAWSFAGAAVIVTGVSTLLCCVVSGFTDLIIGTLEGEDLDATLVKAGRNILSVIEGGLRSIAITAASVPNWPGALIAAVAGILNDTNDAAESVLGTLCEEEDAQEAMASSTRLTLAPTRATHEEFCDSISGPLCFAKVHNISVYYKVVQGETQIPTPEGIWFWNQSPEKGFWIGNTFIGSYSYDYDPENHDDYITYNGFTKIVFGGANVSSLSIFETTLWTDEIEPITGTKQRDLMIEWGGKEIPKSITLRYPVEFSSEYVITGKEIENYLKIEEVNTQDLISYGVPNQHLVVSTHIECSDDSEIFIGCR